MWEIARQTFAYGQPGAVLWQLMFIGVVGYFLAYITTALGKGQISKMIDVVTTFAAVSIVVAVVYGAIVAVSKLAGF